jgi:S-adenosylmethionine-diacylgycerolhomoserine-N-methlytransferase
MSDGATKSSDPANHALLMDHIYRRQRYVYDLTRKYFLFGRDRLIRGLRAASGERVVEIGCGTGRNLIRIGRIYPSVQLYGLDASAEMLKTAETAVARARLSARTVFKHGLAEELKPSLFGLDQPFDHAVFSYSLSMIPDWRAALLAACRSVRPDGFLHVVDFGDFANVWPPLGRSFEAYLGLWHVVPRTEFLCALEGETSAGRDRALYTLPGRYAFVLKAASPAITKLIEARPPVGS